MARSASHAASTPGKRKRGSTPAPDIASVARVELARAADDFFHHHEFAVAGDEEAVHKARVALRRLRSHLRFFSRILDPGWVAETAAAASWYADVLGAVRDLDVLSGRLEDAGRDFGRSSRPGLREVMQALATERVEAVAALQAASATERLADLKSRAWRAALSPPLRGRTDEPAHIALHELLRKPWRGLRETARVAKGDPADGNLHAVRIRAKRLRYASEAAAPTLGKRAERLARAAESVQTNLGEAHDAAAAVIWLGILATERPELAGVARRLRAAERRSAAESAASWKDDVKRVRWRWRRLRSTR